MTDLSPILPKLAKLVPRLACVADGEVVATVRAIDRVLRTGGFDWHDFTAALVPALSPPPPTRARRPSPKAPRPSTWREKADWCARMGPGLLSVKELAFACDMARQLGRHRAPTEKQAAWLQALYGRLGGPQ